MIATMIRRMIIAMHIHFLEFFCSFFAFWRAVFPCCTWSTALETWQIKTVNKRIVNRVIFQTRSYLIQLLLHTVYSWKKSMTGSSFKRAVQLPALQCCQACPPVHPPTPPYPWISAIDMEFNKNFIQKYALFFFLLTLSLNTHTCKLYFSIQFTPVSMSHS